MLDQRAAARGGICLRHVPVVCQQAGHRGHPLGGRCPGELLLKPPSERGIAGLERGHGPGPTLALDHVIEQIR